jgi:hypothetical protein
MKNNNSLNFVLIGILLFCTILYGGISVFTSVNDTLKNYPNGSAGWYVNGVLISYFTLLLFFIDYFKRPQFVSASAPIKRP